MRHTPLPDSAFVVLALLAEREAHGYEIQKLAHDRGFRFWTKLQRSSIYNALPLLEKQHLISAHVRAGEGPDRRVYRITAQGTARLRSEGSRHLTNPEHPRSEIDLGIYALPFLPKADAADAFENCLTHLKARRDFLKERLAWCREQQLRIPALSFERPLLVLDAEIKWLEKVARELAGHELKPDEWARYVYREPPGIGVTPPRKRASDERQRAATTFPASGETAASSAHSTRLRVSLGPRPHRGRSLSSRRTP